ncbi:MAG: efflux RND transporter periplasmic adaptor subunit [Ruminococcaceae bacterium]|nr:efflux RND transporter periplasmic adaptor subunit [Oscillospiraceae bacterium]
MSKRRRTKRNNKKIIIIVAVVAAVLIGIVVAGILLTKDKNADTATVQSVSTICASGNAAGIGNVYAGMVESQKTVNVNANTSYKIAQTYVKVGSAVKAGDKLFTYDMTENAMSAKQAQLDIEKLNNNAAALQEELYQLMEEREEASSSEKDTYSIQILQKQNEIKQNAYDIESKQLELSNLNEEAAQATVTSPIAGVVREIKDLTASSASNVYMTIMATGDYRVQGIINEQNIDEIKAGEKVIVHSRTNDKVWYGRISEIDKDNPVYKDENSATASTDYAFYVVLDSAKGLMLGEHIYIEKNLGLSDKGQIQLPAYYIMDADGKKPYVFADKGGKIERAYLELGGFNEETNTYVVVSGIELTDYIAYPDASVRLGMATAKEK